MSIAAILLYERKQKKNKNKNIFQFMQKLFYSNLYQFNQLYKFNELRKKTLFFAVITRGIDDYLQWSNFRKWQKKNQNNITVYREETLSYQAKWITDWK